MRNVTILLAVVAMLAGTAQADVTPTVYEPFNYYPAGALDGSLSGSTEYGFATGSGWARYGNWPIMLDTTAPAGTNLAYPTGVPLTEVGTCVSESNDYRHQSYRKLATSVDLGANKTFYMSALFEHLPASHTNENLAIHLGDGTLSPGVRFGLHNNWGAGGDDAFYVEIAGTTADTGDLTFNDNETYFLVVKVVTTSGNDKMYLKVYDASATAITEPTTDAGWDAIATGNGSDIYPYLTINNVGPGYTPSDGQIDEFLLGDTWEDVTGVPEPATMVLLGIGGIGVLLRRRKK